MKNKLLIYKLVIINFLINYKYFFYQNIYKEQNLQLEYYQNEINIFFKSIKIKTEDDTLNELINNKKSISRFGDGEFLIIFGENIGFQKFNESLKNKLLNVLNSNFPNLLIGIMRFKIYNNSDKVKRYWIYFYKKYKLRLRRILNKQIYYNACITRYYDPNGNKSNIQNYINKFKTIWNNRNILIIEGEKTRLGIGNDLFNNSKSIKRIICPSENAFNAYEKILEYIKILNLEDDILILVSLGPTATVLTYDIFKLGKQVIDFGHFDLEYEYYLRNATKIMKIPFKYVNEAFGGNKNISKVTDQNYFNQIIMKID